MLPAYLRRLDGIRFSAEWLRPWQAGTLPSARFDNAPQRLAALGIPTLLPHGQQDMTLLPHGQQDMTSRRRSSSRPPP